MPFFYVILSKLKPKKMTRTEIINALIEKYDFKSYLEIGVESGANYYAIKSDDKVGVDPDPISHSTVKHESDTFFETNEKTFDICFIDGLHYAEQVYRDAINCLKFLNEGGIILFHDMMPNSELCAKVPREQAIWTGDCYKAFVQLRSERNDLEMFVINTDWGVGFMRKGKQDLIDLKGMDINYANFDLNRLEWLNLISVDEFQQFLNK
jgi:hypothetical protein